MKSDNIEKLFSRLQGEFDVEDAPTKHEARFLAKLKSTEKLPKRTHFKTWMGIAAGFAILVSLALGLKITNQPTGLASVSPEMAQTQDFYTKMINKELRNIAKQETPKNKMLIQDAMAQMKKLEKDFSVLQKDLIASGDDKRVVYAMIANFQSRIAILKNVLEKIEHVEQIKQKNHENQITI